MDESGTTVDLKRLAAEVSAQHGIRIDADDPMMAVVTLNRLVLEGTVTKILERIEASVQDFETAADRVQVRAGGVLAQEVRDSCLAMRHEAGKAISELCRDHLDLTSGGERKWLVAGLLIALALFGLGIWIGSRLQ